MIISLDNVLQSFSRLAYSCKIDLSDSIQFAENVIIPVFEEPLHAVFILIMVLIIWHQQAQM